MMGEGMWEILLKVTLLLCLPTTAALFARKLSPDLRCKLTLAVLCGVMLLMVSIVVAPEIHIWRVNTLAATPSTALPFVAGEAAAPASVEAASRTGFLQISWLGVYLLVTLFMLLRLFYQNVRCHLMVQRLPNPSDKNILREFNDLKCRMGISTFVRLSVQSASPSTFTWGIRHPVLALPSEFAQWSPAQRRAAFVHEFSHIKRFDCLALNFARIVTALCWWQPLAWFVLHRFRHDIECACDDAVIEQGIPTIEYVNHLVNVARQHHVAVGPAVPMAAGMALKRRVRALLSTSQRRSVMSKTGQRTLWVSVLTIAYALGATQVAAELADDRAYADDRTYTPLIKFAPTYPREAHDSGIEGYVVMQFDIDESGKPYNIRAVEQQPASGIFEQAAIDGTSRFHYLPTRENGYDVVTKGVRNRITFALAKEKAPSEAPVEFAEITKLSDSNTKIRQDLTRQLKQGIEYAEESGNGDRFAHLASLLMGTDPDMAEYFLLRASQLGTTKPDDLKIVGGMILFRQGAFEEATELFTQVSAQDVSNKQIAEQWIGYLERESQRREIVRTTLMDLHR